MTYDIKTKIMDDLMNEIIYGSFEVGDKLPSENELADHYRVPRISIRNAYLKLEEMGYIYSVQGKGRYLQDKHQKIELVLTGKDSFSKKMIDKGYNFVSKNIICKKIDYDQKIYTELNVEQDDVIYKIGRLRIIDDRPIALHISYVSTSVFPNISEDGKEIQSMFAYYYENGYQDFDSNKSILSISYPTLKERKLLKCPSLVPLLVIESNCIDQKSKNVLEYTKIIYRGDAFKYIISHH